MTTSAILFRSFYCLHKIVVVVGLVFLAAIVVFLWVVVLCIPAILQIGFAMAIRWLWENEMLGPPTASSAWFDGEGISAF